MIDRLKTWIAVAGAFVLAVVAAWFRGQQAGKDSADAKQREKQAERQNAYDEIDRQSPDFDQSVDRLRDRSDK